MIKDAHCLSTMLRISRYSKPYSRYLFGLLNLVIFIYLCFLIKRRIVDSPPPRKDPLIGESGSIRSGDADSAAVTPARGGADRRKVILFWTDYFESDNYYFGFGSQPFVDNRCQETRCETTKDRNRLDEADAVIIHSRNLQRSKKRDTLVKGFDFPPRKRPGQRWIFYAMEPPPYSWSQLGNFDSDVLGPVFNWTLTHRHDSDIPNPHAWTSRKSKEASASYVPKDYSKNKTKMIAWLVSHCHPPSKREKYVERLRKHVQVDIYGACGTKTCPRNRDVDCLQTLIHDYKFYLGFENHLCRDYITDKMWKILSRTTTVPIVMGGANYDVDAPPGAFIDARRFEPEDLAAYLKKVAADDNLYNKYHAWRKDWEVLEGDHHNINPGFCRLCDKLHRDGGIKWYESIKDFWSLEKDCFPHLIWWG